MKIQVDKPPGNGQSPMPGVRRREPITFYAEFEIPTQQPHKHKYMVYRASHILYQLCGKDSFDCIVIKEISLSDRECYSYEKDQSTERKITTEKVNVKVTVISKKYVRKRSFHVCKFHYSIHNKSYLRQMSS